MEWSSHTIGNTTCPHKENCHIHAPFLKREYGSCFLRVIVMWYFYCVRNKSGIPPPGVRCNGTKNPRNSKMFRGFVAQKNLRKAQRSARNDNFHRQYSVSLRCDNKPIYKHLKTNDYEQDCKNHSGNHRCHLRRTLRRLRCTNPDVIIWNRNALKSLSMPAPCCSS